LLQRPPNYRGQADILLDDDKAAHGGELSLTEREA
jgi:hypothetical protein